MALDRDLALRALQRVGEPLAMEPEEVAVAVFRIVNSQMADLVRKSTIEQGHDPRDCVLVAYGGAGPTHAAFYGRDIGAKAIMVLPRSTAFSAEGMLTCDIVHTAQGARFLGAPFEPADLEALTRDFDRLEALVLDQFTREDTPHAEVALVREVGVRYRKQAHTLIAEVDRGVLDEASTRVVQQRFERRYATVYGEGALLTSAGIELEAQLVSGTRRIDPPPLVAHELAAGDGAAAVRGTRMAHFAPRGFVEATVLDGAALVAGDVVAGPAIIQRMGDNVVVPDAMVAEVDAYLTMRLR